MPNLNPSDIQKAKEALTELHSRYNPNGFQYEVNHGNMSQEEADKENAIQKRWNDALQTALQALDLVPELEAKIAELKDKALKVEDECIMCPHKKTILEQDKEIAELKALVGGDATHFLKQINDLTDKLTIAVEVLKEVWKICEVGACEAEVEIANIQNIAKQCLDRLAEGEK